MICFKPLPVQRLYQFSGNGIKHTVKRFKYHDITAVVEHTNKINNDKQHRDNTGSHLKRPWKTSSQEKEDGHNRNGPKKRVKVKRPVQVKAKYMQPCPCHAASGTRDSSDKFDRAAKARKRKKSVQQHNGGDCRNYGAVFFNGCHRNLPLSACRRNNTHISCYATIGQGYYKYMNGHCQQLFAKQAAKSRRPRSAKKTS